jgi:pimeloyl-ACP methyl ester carboxylesterase
VLRAALIAAAAFAFAPAAPAAGAGVPCPAHARCSVLQVPLDHTGATPGALPLAYARVPAAETRTGTLVLLAGGPGQAAIPLTPLIRLLLDPLHDHYDLVLVDQRGTGASGAVDCGDADPAPCAAKLGAKRAFLNTTETARDLEDLRVALGVDKLTLLGVSYGTKVAGEYARRYPAHTAAVVLDSPAPVDGLDGVGELRQLGAPRVLREACAPGPCGRTISDPAAALKAAAERLQRGPLKGPSVSDSGRVRTRSITEEDLYQALLTTDLSPLVRAYLPAAIASLAAGDAAPLLHFEQLLSGVAGGGAEDDGINVGRLLATTCIEGRLPWAPDSPVASRKAALDAYLAARGPSPFAPFSAATVLGSSAAALCADWPPTPKPEGVASAGPDLPVLVLSGRVDLRTPTEDARRTAGQYPHATLLTVPGVGHSVLTSNFFGGCALDGTVAFLTGEPVTPCDSQSAGLTLDAVAYEPADLARLKARRLPGRAGRTLTGLRLTLQNVVGEYALHTLFLGRSPSARFPGLRAGYIQVTNRRLVFHGLEWFRGMRVSGALDIKRTVGRLLVSGPAAAHGTILLQGKHAGGTLGGHRIIDRDLAD